MCAGAVRVTSTVSRLTSQVNGSLPAFDVHRFSLGSNVDRTVFRHTTKNWPEFNPYGCRQEAAGHEEKSKKCWEEKA